jgi:hypothetical protein
MNVFESGNVNIKTHYFETIILDLYGNSKQGGRFLNSCMYSVFFLFI